MKKPTLTGRFYKPREEEWIYLLPVLQGDDDEDGPAIHSPHTAAVTHEVVQNGGELCADLEQEENKEV